MYAPAVLQTREIRHFHLFCGLGGGAKGFPLRSPAKPRGIGHCALFGIQNPPKPTRAQIS